jgi:GAF domain-containing protein
MSSTESQSGHIGSLLAQGVGESGVAHVLRTVRKHLEMDVAFISHFRVDDRVFEHVDADGPAPIHVGQAIPLEEGYCLKVVRGELPQFIPDTSTVPACMVLPATSAIPIGAHLSVPVLLAGGEVYGTLCCFRYLPDHSLGERDMRMMRAFAEVLAGRLDENLAAVRLRERAAEEIRDTMAAGAPRMVFQPIYSLEDAELAGVDILNLKSDVIKLDMSLTRNIDVDPGRRALAKGLISFAHDIGSSITAGGVETRAELDALRCLGVDKVQGYFLSRPLPLDEVVTAARTTCPAFG